MDEEDQQQHGFSELNKLINRNQIDEYCEGGPLKYICLKMLRNISNHIIYESYWL